MTERIPLTRTEKILLAAIGLSLVVAVLVPLGFKLSIDAQQRREAGDLARRQASSCAEFNVQAAKQRTAEKAQVRAVVTPRTRTADEQARLAAVLARHDAAIDANYLDRDCTPEGIAAYVDNDPTTDPYVTPEETP